MNEFTPTTAAAYIPAVWSAKVFEYAYEDVLIVDLVVSLDQEVGAYGNTVHMPVMLILSTAVKSADTDVSFSNNTDTDTTISINNYEYVAVAIELQVMKMAKYDLVGLNQKAMGKAIGNRWDAQLASLRSTFTQTSVNAIGTGFQDAGLIDGIRQLDVVNAPDEDRSLVLHPNAWMNFIGIEKFYNSMIFPQQKAMQKYQVAEVYGVRTYKSNNIVTGAGTPAGAYNLLFHREAMGISRSINIDVMMQDMARAGRKEISAFTLYGFGVIRNNFGVVVNS